MSDHIVIKLGEKPYTINRLTIGQLEGIHLSMFSSESGGSGIENARALWDRNVSILAAALSKDHPNMTAEEIRKAPVGTIQDVASAVDDILEFSGLVRKKLPGEARAAEAAAQ